MADPIAFKPRPARIDPDASDALQQLLETAHEHGLLRLANDVIAANTRWMEVIVQGLNQPGSRNVVQNLAALAMVLSQIEPDRLYKTASALTAALRQMDQAAADRSEEAPGLTGAYRMLHDPAIWNAVGPLLQALKTFADAMGRDADKPITEFSGKHSTGP